MADIFFDRQDRELMKMINTIIDYGPSSDLLNIKQSSAASIPTAY